MEEIVQSIQTGSIGAGKMKAIEDEILAEKIKATSEEILMKQSNAEEDKAATQIAEVKNKFEAKLKPDPLRVVLYEPIRGPKKGKLYFRIVKQSEVGIEMTTVREKDAELKDGEIPEGYKLQSRNKPCFCGSGKVFKHCKCAQDQLRRKKARDDELRKIQEAKRKAQDSSGRDAGRGTDQDAVREEVASSESGSRTEVPGENRRDDSAE